MLLSKLDFQDDTIYLVTRGTLSKTHFIADDFNLNDRFSTHVGLAVVQQDSLVIYHVSREERTQPDALYVDGLETFWGAPDVYYGAIWKFVTNAQTVARFTQLLAASKHSNIAFDMDFNPDDDAKQYCSEFCVKTLRSVFPEQFSVALVNKPLESFYKVALQKEALRYWPVDFYTTTPQFAKIFEFHYPN